MIKIYFNPFCSKCKNACTLLDDKGLKYEVIHYLDTPLTSSELKDLVDILGVSAEMLIRKKEPLFAGLFQNKNSTEIDWIDVLCRYPVLMERPIVVKGGKAVIGRRTEIILDFINQ